MWQQMGRWCEFQSTLPSQGATDLPEGIASVLDISIHAPLTGSDMFLLSNELNSRYFNPRSPHRERRFKVNLANTVRNFNPRSPHRERRFPVFPYIPPIISIHAPLTGSDRARSRSFLTSTHFNPRSPHRERHRRRGRSI